MALTIEWKADAEAQLDRTLHYYLANYGRGAASKPYQNIIERLETLERHPESGAPIPGHPQIRYAQIRKGHYLYYTFDDSTLLVLGLYGTRQNDNPYL